MKKFTSFLLLIFMLIQIHAQSSWGVKGAEWYYEYHSFSAAGYIKYTMDSNRIDGSRTYQSFRKQYFYVHEVGPGELAADSSSEIFLEDYTYIENDSVYYFDDKKSRYYLLYDFNAVNPDTWMVGKNNSECEDSLALVEIDSTGTESINGMTLKWLDTRLAAQASFGHSGRIMERIGGVGTYIFPQPLTCPIDIPEGGVLRCYYDPALGWYHHTTNDCTNLPLGISGQSKNNVYSIYPNPVNDVLFIDFPGPGERMIRLLTVDGRLIRDVVVYGDKFILSTLNLTGNVFILEITDDKGNKYAEKIFRSQP